MIVAIIQIDKNPPMLVLYYSSYLKLRLIVYPNISIYLRPSLNFCIIINIYIYY